MPKVTYVEHNGTKHTVEVPLGASLMQGAVANMVPGIEGDCGGLCACATCHVYIPLESKQVCGSMDELEDNMLNFGYDVNENSRLACQIEVTEALDGLTVQLPSRQY
ncbi:MAG: 2Fe-2S iron-sulfur cluster binding domain-containing protein [Gammaproteobacteria bacterium]|jgi:2Fe-2S ferredoxin|nr:2Fe-2S iron-sulfur cluster binding domain-containing protein [Gammaproteobacteria bacterium]MBT6245842.1 2Fe-2S iron-sulfur cluster binding domain-containing protein [Gammaproteobacteria bacterium]